MADTITIDITDENLDSLKAVIEFDDDTKAKLQIYEIKKQIREHRDIIQNLQDQLDTLGK